MFTLHELHLLLNRIGRRHLSSLLELLFKFVALVPGEGELLLQSIDFGLVHFPEVLTFFIGLLLNLCFLRKSNLELFSGLLGVTLDLKG